MKKLDIPSLEAIFGSDQYVKKSRLEGPGPQGRLPLTEEMLLYQPSGILFGMTQSAGMGWKPEDLSRPNYLIISTQGGLRDADGEPIALGYHTGHWEIGLLVRQAAETLRESGVIPVAAYCSDPCDGRTQGTSGMFDSLPYRNDAAITMRRLIRSLPGRQGVMGIATCDKGLPATMMALAGSKELPAILVPGGVTLPTVGSEDAGAVQSIGARFARGVIDLETAAHLGCNALGSSGGGCQFLGTAATSQIIAEALGMALPHSALSPSGEPIWLDLAHRSALALIRLASAKIPLAKILTTQAIENAMLIHAAFGGSTNLLLHIPAIAHAAGLPRPTVEDWIRVNRLTGRLVDVLPNGPRSHPTVQVFMAGGVPEVMLHLREIGLLNLEVTTVSGEKLSEVLDWWEGSERRQAVKKHLQEAVQINPDDVIMSPDLARKAGLTSTLVFPIGNLAPQGSVIKATAIDPSEVAEDNVYCKRGPARVFTSEKNAIASVKGQSEDPVQPGDIIVLIGGGPSGTGMEETYQLTAALKHLPWGKKIALLTDARFSGVSTGACIGHIGPEALAGGPISKIQDGDIIEIIIDRNTLSGEINLVATPDGVLNKSEATELLSLRRPHPALSPHPELPEDTRLWGALQSASGGTWEGCIYDIERIIEVIEAGSRVLEVASLNVRP